MKAIAFRNGYPAVPAISPLDKTALPASILWYGSAAHRDWLAPAARLTSGTPTELAAGTFDALVVEVNAEPGRRAARSGLRWLQRFRRETDCLAPALLYSFESRATLARECSLLAEGTPGIAFLRAPFSFAEFRQTLEALVPLTPAELQGTVRWRSGLQDEWRAQAHALGTLLTNWPSSRARAERLLDEWEASVQKYAPDQRSVLHRLHVALASPVAQIREAIQALEDGLCRRPEDLPEAARAPQGTVPEAALLESDPPRRPPRGFAALMAADDQGYEPSTIQTLKGLGYSLEVARALDEAEALLDNWCPQVVLADLHFPSWEEGQALLRRAEETACVRLVIATSRARAGTLPPGVEDCCGGLDFQDAERIHRIIWRRARAEGIETDA